MMTGLIALKVCKYANPILQMLNPTWTLPFSKFTIAGTFVLCLSVFVLLLTWIAHSNCKAVQQCTVANYSRGTLWVKGDLLLLLEPVIILTACTTAQHDLRMTVSPAETTPSLDILNPSDCRQWGAIHPHFNGRTHNPSQHIHPRNLLAMQIIVLSRTVSDERLDGDLPHALASFVPTTVFHNLPF